MRIIAGAARGRRLISPEGNDTRPTSDRVRESLFSIILGHVDGARVLDLFSGSGALALEAMSRGAASCVLNDFSRSAVKVIERNVEAVRAENVKVLCLDWRAALDAVSGTKFSLVFLDPPYRLLDVYGQALTKMRALGLLDDGALIVMEHDARSEVPLPMGFVSVDERKYGDTRVSFVKEGDGA